MNAVLAYNYQAEDEGNALANSDVR